MFEKSKEDYLIWVLKNKWPVTRQKRQEGEIYTDKEWEKAQSSSRESRGEASKPTLTFNSIYWTLLCIGLSAKHFTNSAASNSQNQPVK